MMISMSYSTGASSPWMPTPLGFAVPSSSSPPQERSGIKNYVFDNSVDLLATAGRFPQSFAQPFVAEEDNAFFETELMLDAPNAVVRFSPQPEPFQHHDIPQRMPSPSLYDCSQSKALGASAENLTLSPQVTARKSRGVTRVPIFAGEPLEFPVERLLALDSNGIPNMATPILKYGASRGWSIEAMLKQASIGQFNTAVRYWFKGLNLSRQSVLEGAAVIVEWYEALHEGRSRRNTMINMTKVPQILQEMTSSSKSRKGPGPKRSRSTGDVHFAKRSRTASAISLPTEEKQNSICVPPLHRVCSEPIMQFPFVDDDELPLSFIGAIGKPTICFDDDVVQEVLEFL